MAMKQLLNHPRKNPWQKYLLAVAAALIGSFQIVLAVEQDSRESLPRPRVMPSHALLLVNETLRLTCLSQDNATSIQWLRDDCYLQPNHQLHLSEGNQTLIQMGITKADAGAYQCEIRNLIDFRRSNATIVSVAYGPDAVEISPSGNITQLFGSPLTLRCSADSVPAAQFSWFFNNTSVDQNGSLLVVNSTEGEHEGTYECWAYNAVTNLTVQASVSVVIDQESLSAQLPLIPRVISGIVIGLLAGVVLIVIPVYCFRAHVQSEKSPQVTSTTSPCDNHASGMQASPGPKLENSADSSSTYQALQYRDEALYQELSR